MDGKEINRGLSPIISLLNHAARCAVKKIGRYGAGGDPTERISLYFFIRGTQHLDIGLYGVRATLPGV
jgi:hypothetical protein